MTPTAHPVAPAGHGLHATPHASPGATPWAMPCTTRHASACTEALFKAVHRTTPAVHAPLSYLQPTAQRPRSYACEPPPGEPWENCSYEARVVPIADVRQASLPPDIDREGFELWTAPTAVRDFTDEAAIRSVYYREAAELALAVTGASQAHVFDHLVRRREADRGALNFGRRTAGTQAAANGRIHNDYSEASGLARRALVLPHADAALRQRRFAIVNIWRSINGPVRDTPLALCDAQSVSAPDLVVGDVCYPGRRGEIYLLQHAPRHRWWYASAMDVGDALVFKQYDSQLGGVARYTPHAAFDLPEVPADAPRRVSIELRCLVVYDAPDAPDEGTP